MTWQIVFYNRDTGNISRKRGYKRWQDAAYALRKNGFTQIIRDHIPYVSSGSYSKTHDPKYKGASRKGGAAKIRSKTFPGIARAMAEQWGGDHHDQR